MSGNVIEFSIKALDNFSATMGRLDSQLGAMNRAFAALAAVYPIAKAIEAGRAFLENAEQMGVMAQKAGMATDKFSSLAYAARMSNVDVGALQQGMKFLGTAMTANDSGFARLGVSTRTASGDLRSTSDVLIDVADKFSTLRDGAAKTQLAIDLFGRSGLSMVPMLNSGGESIRALMADAQRLGIVITDDMAAAADQVNDNFAAMSMVMQGQFNQALARVLPTLESVSNMLVEFFSNEERMKGITEALTVTFKTIGTVVIGLGQAFNIVGDTVGNVAAAMVQAAQGNFSEAWNILTADTKHLQDDMSNAFTNIEQMWNDSATSAAASTARTMAAMRRQGAVLKEENKEAIKAEDQRQKALEAAMAAMEKENLLMGASSESIKLYELANLGATDAQLARAQAIQESIRIQQEGAEFEQAIAAFRAANAEQDMATTQEQMIAREQAAREHWDRLMRIAVDSGLSQTQFEKLNSVQQVQIASTKFQQLIGQAANYSKVMFQLNKAAALANAFVSFRETVVDAYKWGTKMGSPILGAVMAAAAAAAQAVNIAALVSTKPPAAHGGLDYVPAEQTYLLAKGERVLSPRQNRDLTEFMQTGGGGNISIGTVEIHVLENATSADAFAKMNRIELRNALGQPVIDALNEMFKIGVRPAFAKGVV
mgnify:FL=1